MNTIFLTADWQNLIMANYEVDPALLKKYLPYQTELDLWDGKAYVSLVGFLFTNTRVLRLPVPFHRNFEEVNLRFYVKYRDQEGTLKRGVTFISEIVPKKAIPLVANTLYGEKYSSMRMRNTGSIIDNVREIGYFWKPKIGLWNHLKVAAHNTPQPLEEGSKAQFILEHYWGYTQFKPQKTIEYQVEHPSWRTFPVQSYDINCDFDALYGSDFAFLKEKEPNSIYLAEGSEVIVRRGTKLWKPTRIRKRKRIRN